MQNLKTVLFENLPKYKHILKSLVTFLFLIFVVHSYKQFWSLFVSVFCSLCQHRSRFQDRTILSWKDVLLTCSAFHFSETFRVVLDKVELWLEVDPEVKRPPEWAANRANGSPKPRISLIRLVVSFSFSHFFWKDSHFTFIFLVHLFKGTSFDVVHYWFIFPSLI